MFQIKHICKQYKTGGLVQKVLDGVSLNLRESEFVAILGPSGSGKTTLLNIIGGLDRYDRGDLVINGISTKKYKERDWDSYRNHTIGFVFQSYNLIAHQTVLSNVELALTISGVSKAKRKKLAKRALEQVGLGDQLHKKPNQMSGGQMQRVAIARALVNDPDILLADEPTGALDSETSIQVMELLKEVAKDRLVVMVTHNPELAEQYATRIVKLKDGKICSDSAPYQVDEADQGTPVHRNMGKSSMSFLTALSLSFNNLRTKKARTFLTSFAGSIGIIGIALILAISNGVNAYIQSMEEETLSEYPLQIQSASMSFASLMSNAGEEADGDTGEVRVSQMLGNMLSKVEPNDLESLRNYFDSGKSGIEEHSNAIEYAYDVAPQIFRLEEEDVRQVNPDRSFSALGIGSGTDSFMSSFMNTDVFYQMPENEGLFRKQYDVKAGRWPKQYNECVLVLTSGGSISDFMLYTLGLRDSLELDEMLRQFLSEEEIETPGSLRPYGYGEFLGISFKLVNAADYYEYDEDYGVWKDKSGDNAYMRDLVRKGEDLTIVGVVQPSKEAAVSILGSGIAYPASLTGHVIEQAASKRIVREQQAKPGFNVLTGNSFGEDNSKSRFQMDSLFTVNEEALRDAFEFDQSAFDINMPGYSGMDSSAFDLSGLADFDDMILDMPEFSELPELSGLSGIDMGDILGQLDLSVSPESIRQLFYDLLDGYGSYAAEHPEADYSRIWEYVMDYVRTPEVSGYLQEEICQILRSNVEAAVQPDQLQPLMQDLMAGFQEYAAANGFTDPEKSNEYLLMYLQTPEAQQKLMGAADAIQISGDLSVLPEQMEEVISVILTGYQEYAAANHLPDPCKMGEYFMLYLQTPSARQKLSDGISEILDVGSLESQISGALNSFMEELGDPLKELMSLDTGGFARIMQAQVTSILQQVLAQMGNVLADSMQQAMSQLGASMENAFQINGEAFANAIEMNMDEEELTELLRSLMSAENASLDNNLKKFGYADFNKPSQISIYPRDFKSKAAVLEILDRYNSRMEAEGHDEKVISYTDMVGTLMSSVTEIVDMISYVLVAFVAISLVVSSIMIGVITYISVLERKKEIGILRAIGASRGNISQVFNAETFIIGLCAGVIGIGLTLVLLIPGNALIHSITGSTDINAALPAIYGGVLIALSVLLTLTGGLIPSGKAAKSDPVTALRSE